MLRQTRVQGFTLIELLVVISIIGLMASTVLASLAASRIAARDASRVQVVKELQKALELYRNANSGNYPCATTMPACAGNAAAGVEINIGTNSVTTAINSYYRPSVETILASIGIVNSPSLPSSAASVIYRVGSSAGTEVSPDQNTYTILLRREQAVGAIPANTWCKVNSGNGHSAWAGYANCF